jgi:hypothetical protein
MEGFGNNPFTSRYGDAPNPFSNEKGLGYSHESRPTFMDAPTVSSGPSAISASEYQNKRLAPGVSFDSYKRPTEIRTPRGEYTAMGPTAKSASQYLRQKYGDFSSATEIVPKAPPAAPQTQIMGADAVTLGDLKLLQNAVDAELLRLQNIRTVSVVVDLKKAHLSALGDNLADVIGRVERKEITVDDVAIFPATARQFLKTFRSSETLPELFDPNGNSPASLAPAPAFAPALSSSIGEAPSAREAKSEPTQKPDFLQWLYTNIQAIKWSLDANYRVEQAKDRQMRESLKEMEQRVLAYSYGDTPMPAGYQGLFLNKIHELQKELKDVPE